MKAFKEIPKIAHEIAHKYCEGRWIAVGGGGYDIWRVVPRAWSYIWLEMTENNTPLSDLPLDWIEKWQPLLRTSYQPHGKMMKKNISPFQDKQKLLKKISKH